MKLGLTLSGINKTLQNLEQAGVIIEKDFKSGLIDQGKILRDKAKQILEQKSAQRTSKRYWTGKLQESIKLNISTERKEMIGITVGPDLRVAPYAEWVEIGHFLVAGEFGQQRGGWWEGYHYLEGAYTEMADEIPKKIAETISLDLERFGRAAGRTRHLVTGRFVGGFAMID